MGRTGDGVRGLCPVLSSLPLPVFPLPLQFPFPYGVGAWHQAGVPGQYADEDDGPGEAGGPEAAAEQQEQ